MSVKGCGHEYEYDPHGVFGIGHGSPLGPSVKVRGTRPLGLLPARDRSNEMTKRKKRTKAQGRAAAATKQQKKNDKKAGVVRKKK